MDNINFRRYTTSLPRPITFPDLTTQTDRIYNGLISRPSRRCRGYGPLSRRLHGDGGELRASLTAHRTPGHQGVVTVQLRLRSAEVQVTVQLEQAHDQGLREACTRLTRHYSAMQRDRLELDRISNSIASLSLTPQVDNDSARVRRRSGALAVERQAPAPRGLSVTASTSELRALFEARQTPACLTATFRGHLH